MRHFSVSRRMQDLPQEVVTDIDKDIRRTYPCYVQFGSAEGQEELRMVLRAYAAYDPEVGVTLR